MRSSIVIRSTVALAAAMWAVTAQAQGTAACSLFGTSYADAILNPSKGEDVDFFVSTGGIPSVMMVLDNSTSVQRLAPNGAARSWGTFGPAAGCTNAWADSLTYASPCGGTTVEGSPYVGTTDFADKARVCPHFVNGNQPPGTNQPGFDPSFYPTFFPMNPVFHDNDGSPGGTGAGGNWSGWTHSGTNQASGSVAAFCGANPTCTSCMNTKGYYFNGTYYKAQWMNDGVPKMNCGFTSECQSRGFGICVDKPSQTAEYNGGNPAQGICRLPHVYFTGNFLNFQPPKFIVARKILKDLIMYIRRIRLGMATWSSSGSGGSMMKDFNPPCHKTFPPNKSNFDSNRSSFVNGLDSIGFNVAHSPIAETLLNVSENYRTSSLPWFGNGAWNEGNPVNGFKISPQFEDKGGNNASYCFKCQSASVILVTDGYSFNDTHIPGPAFAPSPMTAAVASGTGNYAGMAGFNIQDISATECPLCNTPAEAPDTSLAGGFCLMGSQASGGCAAGEPVPSYLPKVAWYMHHMDHRADSEVNSTDCQAMTGKQLPSVYTVGLGAQGPMATILEHTAYRDPDDPSKDVGGGFFVNSTDAKTLRDGLLSIFEDINTRSTSFGVASISTLQATAGQAVTIPRFDPSRSAHWNGHLFRFALYSEFAAGCTPYSYGDLDCDGSCSGVYLMDKDGHFISEDGTGTFRKNIPNNKAMSTAPINPTAAAGTCRQHWCFNERRVDPCPNGSGGACYYGGWPPCAEDIDMSQLAKPYWDASEKLKEPAKVKWKNRSVFTIVDNTGDGKIDQADTLLDFRVNDALANAILPYANVQGSPFCTDLANSLALAGFGALGNLIKPPNYTACVKVMVAYLLGADVFNDSKRPAAPGVPAPPLVGNYPPTGAGVDALLNGLFDRPFLLGDIFHSSPVDVVAPLRSEGLLCSLGLHNQCLASLWLTATQDPPATPGFKEAYDDYAKAPTLRYRDRFALVGANDGMLHAFVTGEWKVNKNDPRTIQKEDQLPFEGYYEVDPSPGAPNGGCTRCGQEMWAFVPPDLLAKMPLFMGKVHHFFVDGTPMVRDVWVDGSSNGLVPMGSFNDIKEGSEFHTVAVVGERRGGTHYFALDVTNSTIALGGRPKFLWIYPQPTDKEQLKFGQTYSDFLPTPPPIGPVRIDANFDPRGGPTGNQMIFPDDGVTPARELWVTMVGGGFDPAYGRGRGVHMIDVWTGKEVFDFSQPAGCVPASVDPKCKLQFPVAASMAMVMWGNQSRRLGDDPPDGFFDTATFGDTGGQLWTVRFRKPGRINGATGLVDNWFGGRSYKFSDANLFCGDNQPFFYITSNTWLTNGLWRTFAGTGDRYNLLNPRGGTCSPDNIRACIMKGCTVTIGGADNRTKISPLLGEQQYTTTATSCGAVTQTDAVTAGAPGSCTSVEAEVKISINCAAAPGGVEAIPDPTDPFANDTATVRQMQVNCMGSGSSCISDPLTDDPGDAIRLCAVSNHRNHFVSVKVFDDAGSPRQIFNDAAGAQAYDGAHYTLANLTVIDGASTTPPVAPAGGPGWAIYFNHTGSIVLPPVTSGPSPACPGDPRCHTLFQSDERSASTSAMGDNCVLWNTMHAAMPGDGIPPGCPGYTTGGSCSPSPCKSGAGKQQVSYFYGATPDTGAICIKDENGTPRRSRLSYALVPPPAPQLTAFVNEKGQVSFGMISVRVPKGGSSDTTAGGIQDPTSTISSIEIPREVHECRHGVKGNAPAPLPAMCGEPAE
jgi:type IV pilus assembly protein PilY1